MCAPSTAPKDGTNDFINLLSKSACLDQAMDDGPKLIGISNKHTQYSTERKQKETNKHSPHRSNSNSKKTKNKWPTFPWESVPVRILRCTWVNKQYPWMQFATLNNLIRPTHPQRVNKWYAYVGACPCPRSCGSIPNLLAVFWLSISTTHWFVYCFSQLTNMHTAQGLI
jgi:hypothetical protein